MKKILLICIIVMVAVGAIGATAYLINSFKTDSGKSSESMVYINFDSNGGTIVPNQIINKGDSVTEPIAPTREYYTFDGWYLDDTKYVFEGSSASEDLTLQAKWIANYVSYNALNGTVGVGPETYLYNNFTQPISGVVRYSLTPGGSFQYLNFDTVSIQTTARQYGDLYVGGIYFYNSLYPTLKVRYTTSYQAHPTYYDSKGDLVDVPSSDGGYQISFNIIQTILNGEVKSTYYYYASGRDSINHYRIVGVGDSSEYKLLFDEMFTITFFDKAFTSVCFSSSDNQNSRYPHFVVSDSSKTDVNYNLVSVIFDPNNGGDIKKYTAVKNSILGLSYVPSKPNYDFVGWYYGNTAVALNDYVIKQDVTLTARWTPKPVYTITFDSNGGSSIASQSVISGHNAVEPMTPTKNGSTFLYWSLNGDQFNFSTLINSSITLTAVWGHTVTFDSNGGSSVSSQTVVSGQTATQPQEPTKTDYTFACWTLNNAAFSFSTPITSDITLVASWTAVSPVSYIVTFDSNGGSEVSSQTVVGGQTATEPTAPTKDGYTFVCWTIYVNDSLGHVEYDFDDPVTSSITLLAEWSENTPDPQDPTTDDNLTDLTNTKWLFNNTITELTAGTYYLNFYWLEDEDPNSKIDCETIVMTNSNNTILSWQSDPAYIYRTTNANVPTGWVDEQRKTIYIVDGLDTTNTTLINWLTNNATLLSNTTNSEDPTTDPINPLDPIPDPEDDPDDPDPTYFTVTYYDYDEQNTFSRTPVQRRIFNTEQVLEGGLPENYNNYPSSAYFIFQYWAYIDSGEEFDPSSPIYEDVFLIPIGTNAGSMD